MNIDRDTDKNSSLLCGPCTFCNDFLFLLSFVLAK